MIYKRSIPASSLQNEDAWEACLASPHEAPAHQRELQTTTTSAVMLRLLDPVDIDFIHSVDATKVRAAKRLRVQMYLIQVRNLAQDLGAARREASVALNPEFLEADFRASLAIVGLRVCAGLYMFRSQQAYGWACSLLQYLPAAALLPAQAESFAG